MVTVALNGKDKKQEHQESIQQGSFIPENKIYNALHALALLFQPAACRLAENEII